MAEFWTQPVVVAALVCVQGYLLPALALNHVMLVVQFGKGQGGFLRCLGVSTLIGSQANFTMFLSRLIQGNQTQFAQPYTFGLFPVVVAGIKDDLAGLPIDEGAQSAIDFAA